MVSTKNRVTYRMKGNHTVGHPPAHFSWKCLTTTQAHNYNMDFSCFNYTYCKMHFLQISPEKAPMCCVIPPASDAAIDDFLSVSSKVVLPWSTCPIIVTTGGLGRRADLQKEHTPHDYIFCCSQVTAINTTLHCSLWFSISYCATY